MYCACVYVPAAEWMFRGLKYLWWVNALMYDFSHKTPLPLPGVGNNTVEKNLLPIHTITPPTTTHMQTGAGGQEVTPKLFQDHHTIITTSPFPVPLEKERMVGPVKALKAPCRQAESSSSSSRSSSRSKLSICRTPPLYFSHKNSLNSKV